MVVHLLDAGRVFGRHDRGLAGLVGGDDAMQMRDAVAVMFDPGIKEADLRRIVLGAGARIVDGPSSTDVFVLEIPAERTARALEALRAEPEVRLAERLGPRTTR